MTCNYKDKLIFELSFLDHLIFKSWHLLETRIVTISLSRVMCPAELDSLGLLYNFIFVHYIFFIVASIKYSSNIISPCVTCCDLMGMSCGRCFLLHLLKYHANEAKNNIPDIV